MTTARRVHYSYEDYLVALAMSDVKLEYCDGEIYAMAGGTPAHAFLIAATTSALRNRLHGRCNVASEALRIRIESSDLDTFTDVSVICGELISSKRDKNAATNPTLLVEVTSRSTEDYDRGDKLSHYKQVPSLRAVLFVSHKTRKVTVVQRDAAGWSTRDFRGGETVTVDEPSLSILVDELYEGITLDTP
jgi:Uma2 family endonuclease